MNPQCVADGVGLRGSRGAMVVLKVAICSRYKPGDGIKRETESGEYSPMTVNPIQSLIADGRGRQ